MLQRFDGPFGKPHDAGGLSDAQALKEAEHDNLLLPLVEVRQGREDTLHRQLLFHCFEWLRIVRERVGCFVQRNECSAAFGTVHVV